MTRAGWDDWDEPSLTREVIERRGQPRGVVRGLVLIIPAGHGTRVDAVEASAKGFFARVDDPERYLLGDLHEVEVSRGALGFRCRVEVVRKQIAPRPGVALRVVRITPEAQALLAGLVEVD